MPWLMCTTGSPTFSSDRSLISALTSLTCSCLRRRRAVGEVANSSVSVTNWMATPLSGSNQKKPCASGATAIAKCSSPAMNSASEPTVGGSMRLSRSSSSRLSRRPSLSATISTRCGVVPTCSCSRCSGSCAPRSALRSGSGRAQGVSSWPRSASVACGAVCTKNSSGFRNRASGGRIGRSRSCCRKRWRSRVSTQKRLSASSTSPCKTSAASAPR